MIYELPVKTTSHTEMIDITAQVQQIVTGSQIQQGLCTVFVPHTTAGITINENADPDVVYDMTHALEKIVPWHDGYRHCEGNSAAHLKATMTGASQTVMIEHGKLLLGVWQSLYFCEYDGSRSRKVYIKIIEG
jgi:secondary thiamine-phosphate synthase enzyme